MKTISPTNPNAFIVLFRDLDRWSVGSFIKLDWNWPVGVVRSLSTALRRKQLAVQGAVKPEELPLVTLHFDGNMELRGKRGAQVIKGRLWWADPGDVVYSKIDVRNGAIGIVPSALGRICVTSEYPVYAVDPNVATAQYIRLLFRTESFRRKINGMISGASGRKRVQPENLETIQVPLPPLSTQKFIVRAWEREQAEITDIWRKINELEKEIEANFLSALGVSQPRQSTTPKAFAVWWKDIDRWSVEYLRRDLYLSATIKSTSKYPLVPLKKLCSSQSGSTPSKRNRDYWSKGTVPWVSPKDMKTDEIYDSVDHITEEAIASGSAPLVPSGSVLIVIRSGILQHTIPIAISRIGLSINQDIRCFTPKTNAPILAEFIAIYLKMSPERLLAAVKWSTTVQSINKESLDELEIPVPPLDLQQNLVTEVLKRRKLVEALRLNAEQKAKQVNIEVEAMIKGDRFAITT